MTGNDRAIIIARHPTGFEVRIAVDLDAIDQRVTWLMSLGFRPTISGDGYQRTPTGEPLCPKHQTVMSLRQRQNDEWYSHRIQANGRELWCRGYATGKADDGYLVD